MRYFLVIGSEKGHSAFLSAWSLGSLKLAALFPPAGDAPGSDLNGIPRPRQGRRVLSAGVVGGGRIVSYRAAITPNAALNDYSSQLRSAGWQLQEVTGQRLTRLGIRNERALLISATQISTGSSDEVDLTLCEL
jgi:hypothetical protein